MKNRIPDQGWSRRNFLGAAGSLGAAGALGAASFLPRIAHAAGSSRRLVLVRAFGGWDTTFCMDPRLTVPGVIDGPDRVSTDETIASYGDLPIMASSLRPNMDSFFSAFSDSTLVVNGISVGSIVHEICRQRISMEAGSRARIWPASRRWSMEPETLPYLDLTGVGRVGPYAALRARWSPTRSSRSSTGSPTSCTGRNAVPALHAVWRPGACHRRLPRPAASPVRRATGSEGRLRALPEPGTGHGTPACAPGEHRAHRQPVLRFVREHFRAGRTRRFIDGDGLLSFGVHRHGGLVGHP